MWNKKKVRSWDGNITKFTITNPNFDNYSLTGWSQHTDASYSTISVVTGTGFVKYPYCVELCSDASANTYIYQNVDFTKIKKLRFYFKQTGNEWARFYCTINGNQVYYSNVYDDTWREITIDVSGYNGTYQLLFRAYKNGSAYAGQRAYVTGIRAYAK